MKSVDYDTVVLLIILFCKTCNSTNSTCHCLHRGECDDTHQPCVSGCKTGFTGSRCQYVNLLAFSSCKENNEIFADGDYTTCKTTSQREITCKNVEERFNTIRINSGNTGLQMSFYVKKNDGWGMAKKSKIVTRQMTEYEYRDSHLNGQFKIDLAAYICEVEVSYECPAGSYGNNCSSSCSPGCSSSKRCNHVTGECYYCKDGWTHLDARKGKCDKKECSVGCAEDCVHADGTCNKCKPGWIHSDRTLPQCDSKCQRGYYGKGCRHQCNPRCRGGKCNHVDGSCECKDGWTGTQCSSSVKGNTKPALKTLSLPSTTLAPKHSKTECQKGYYGKGCRQPCMAGCRRGNCNPVDGSCECKDGWTGRQCSSKCPAGSYGNNCSLSCSPGCSSSQPCNHVTGVCYNCKDGWTHLDTSKRKCDKKCHKGYYGKGCRQPCMAGCRRGNCNPVDGSCECKDGWTGTQCSSKCPAGSYGNNCSSSCSPGCSSSQPCSHVSGVCYNCKQGWTHLNTRKRKCDKKECSVGCAEGCVQANGTCNKCKPGWIHSDRKLPQCDSKCDSSTYGEGCSLECSTYCRNQSCHHMVGVCLDGCVEGRSGVYCEVDGTSGPELRITITLMIIFLVLVLVSLHASTF